MPEESVTFPYCIVIVIEEQDQLHNSTPSIRSLLFSPDVLRVSLPSMAALVNLRFYHTIINLSVSTPKGMRVQTTSNACHHISLRLSPGALDISDESINHRNKLFRLVESR